MSPPCRQKTGIVDGPQQGSIRTIGTMVAWSFTLLVGVWISILGWVNHSASRKANYLFDCLHSETHTPRADADLFGRHQIIEVSAQHSPWMINSERRRPTSSFHMKRAEE
eukprot:5035748-Amphidinium_carterae.1